MWWMELIGEDTLWLSICAVCALCACVWTVNSWTVCILIFSKWINEFQCIIKFVGWTYIIELQPRTAAPGHSTFSIVKWVINCASCKLSVSGGSSIYLLACVISSSLNSHISICLFSVVFFVFSKQTHMVFSLSFFLPYKIE